MMTITRFALTMTLVLCAAPFVNVQAQTPAIEILTGNDRAHFSTQGQSHGIHVEVFSPAGELIFEQASAPGEPVLWRMANDKGERVAVGVYLATITVTDSSGKRRKRIEQIIVGGETQPNEVLSVKGAIAPTGKDDVKNPKFSSARMQTVSFSGNPVTPIPPDVNAGRAIRTREAIDTTSQPDFSGTTLSLQGANNLFLGQGAGASNTTGSGNSFFGVNAGRANVSSDFNSFFGFGAGQQNIASNNTFFGTLAGLQNTSGTENTFFGRAAGQSNKASSRNSFFGYVAGLNNIGGISNSFFGAHAGQANTNGSSNSFFGTDAGVLNTDGRNNSFFGMNAGAGNTGSHNNSFFGYSTGGRGGGDNSFFGVSAGGFNTGSENSIFGSFAGFNNRGGYENSFFGKSAGEANSYGYRNSFFGHRAGASNNGAGNTFIGYRAGDLNTLGNNNTFIGSSARGLATLNNATAIGANAYVTQNNSLVLGSITGFGSGTADTNVGIGTAAPQSRLHVATGYVQLPFVANPPPASDCTAATAGRMVVFANGAGAAQLYICDTNPNGPSWVIK